MPQSQTPVVDRTAQAVAEHAAAYAHIGFISSRHGLLPCDGHLVVAYDNNPYINDRDRRGRELEALKAKMAGIGCELVGEASYPKEGESIGCTVALVWRGPKLPSERAVTRLWRDILVGQMTL